MSHEPASTASGQASGLPVASGPRAPALGYPVQAVDKFFLLFEGLGLPVTAMWAFRVEGEELDRARFSEAVARTLQRHPKAACRLSQTRTGLLSEKLAWQPIEGAAAAACHFHAPADSAGAGLPLERLCEVMNSPLDPAAGPLVQLHWLPEPGGAATLAFRFHHALCDGHGSLPFLRDLLAHYNGQPLPGAEPDYGAEPEPQLPDRGWAKLRLFGRLLSFHFWRSSSYRFAPPAKLFDLRKRPGGRIDSVARFVEPEKLSRYLAASRQLGVSFNDLLLAAHGLAIARWNEERGLPCGTLRGLVNQNLRSRDRDYPLLENRSSAFPVWIGPEDRKLGKQLPVLVHKQVQECLDQRIAEATVLMSSGLRLPTRWARALVLPAAVRPRLSDSFVLSNLGKLPDSVPGQGWFYLGKGRITAALPFVRAPEGVGALSFAVTVGGRLSLGWSFLTGVLDRAEMERLLELEEAALDELGS